MLCLSAAGLDHTSLFAFAFAVAPADSWLRQWQAASQRSCDVLKPLLYNLPQPCVVAFAKVDVGVMLLLEASTLPHHQPQHHLHDLARRLLPHAKHALDL